MRVISGGQTGADVAALRAAKRLGLRTGGTAPPKFMTSCGVNADLRDVYGLVEYSEPTTSLAQAYVARSKRNVDDSDAMVAFRLGRSAGTDKTIGYAMTGRWAAAAVSYAGGATEPPATYRPVLVLTSLAVPGAAESIRAFVKRHRIGTLNVCGHRAWAALPNFESLVEEIVHRALKPRPE
jgi:hypothetical protein